jgi:hypothetical protein
MSFGYQVLGFGSKAAAAPAYLIPQSIRFNDDDDAYMHRTPDAAGNLQIWTYSVWFKRSNLTSVMNLFNAGASEDIAINAANQLIMNMGTCNFISTQVFRDPSAWYHLIVAVDTTNATAASRVRFYLNGVEITSFGTETNPAEDENLTVNSAVRHTIGANEGNTEEWDGYIADAHLVDGTVLAATSFGKLDTNGVWVPINYSGSYGTNGFHIKGATDSALGDDTSGNGNDYTTTGLTAADQMLDSPTDDVDNGVANFPTLSPLFRGADADVTPALSNGNLTITLAGATSGTRGSTMAIPTTGKWYFECTIDAAGSDHRKFGIITTDSGCLFDATENPPGFEAGDFALNMANGYKLNNDTGASYGAAATGGIVQMAVDMDNSKIWWGDDDTWYASGDPANGTNAAYTSLAAVEYYVVVNLNRDAIITVNFGQLSGDFEYAPPTGFKALCTANLPAPAIVDGSAHCQVEVFTGTGAENAITLSGNSAMNPDLAIFIDNDTDAIKRSVVDNVRGATKFLITDNNLVEATDTQGLKSFDTGGVTLGTDTEYNQDGGKHSMLTWAANGTGSSNESGSINTTATSANAAAGFSISTYTGSGTAATIGHGLSTAPSVIWVKKRTNDAQDWFIYHNKNTTAPATDYLTFESAATADLNTIWNDTAPTDDVFSIGTHTGVNDSGGSDTYVAYCFADVVGYFKAGSYVGNASANGPINHCGFRPKLIICKKASATGSWGVFDTSNGLYNADSYIQNAILDAPNLPGTQGIDFLSNGFKIRQSSSGFNANGATFVWMAFAENPFGGDGVSQARAR